MATLEKDVKRDKLDKCIHYGHEVKHTEYPKRDCTKCDGYGVDEKGNNLPCYTPYRNYLRFNRARQNI